MDRRDHFQLYGPCHDGFDEKAMTVTYAILDEDGDEETVTLPAKFEVCGTCNGKGRHVNPSIDAHGLSAEDFAEDPSFKEDYFTGVYDVDCAECGGKRVVPEVDETRCTPDQAEALKRVQTHLEEECRHRAEDEHCRKMGY